MERTAEKRPFSRVFGGSFGVLKGFDDGRKRLRIGSWRVIYRVEPTGKLEVLFVIDIGNRGDIYK